MTDAVRVEGAAGLARGLDQAAKDQRRALAAANRSLGRDVRGWARADATAGTGQQRRMAGGIGTKADARSVSLTVKNTKGAPGAQGAFYGAKRFAQFPPWVGTGWSAGDRNAGPQPINTTLADRGTEIAERFLAESFKSLERIPPKPKP